MSTMLETAVDVSVRSIEAVAALMILAALAVGRLDLARTFVRRRVPDAIEAARLNLAQRLVLSFEFLIAADVLKTVVTPTFDGMALLGGIVLIRTTLGLSIAYELRKATGRAQADHAGDATRRTEDARSAES